MPMIHYSKINTCTMPLKMKETKTLFFTWVYCKSAKMPKLNHQINSLIAPCRKSVSSNKRHCFHRSKCMILKSHSLHHWLLIENQIVTHLLKQFTRVCTTNAWRFWRKRFLNVIIQRIFVISLSSSLGNGCDPSFETICAKFDWHWPNATEEEDF